MELEELIRSIDIVEYISQFVDLTQKGDEFWGLSCFKEEKTPSFSVRRAPPFFYDYSSGLGGNIFTFVKCYNKCSNSEAIEILKKYAHYDGKISQNSGKMAATIDCKRFMRRQTLQKPSNGVVLQDECMEKYEKRDEKLRFWETEGISRASLEKFQIAYDGFSNRLTYPIRNLDGKIVNIGGRTLDPHWKDKNLRKYTYFYKWGTLDVVYGLFENMKAVRNSKEIIIFEGCKSVLLADTWGIHNTGAILTSHLNQAQLKILARLGCNVIFALDKDVNIRNDRNISKLKDYVNVWYMYDRDGLLNSKDSPVDMGYEVFKVLYDRRIRFK